MKKRSGNGTNNRQWLYLMWNVPLIFLVKIGISGNKNRRAKEVSDKVFGWAIPVFAVKVPFAYPLEKSLHWLFSPFNIRFGGGREWFFCIVAPLALVVMLAAFLIEWALWIGIALFVSWMWAGRPEIF